MADNDSGSWIGSAAAAIASLAVAGLVGYGAFQSLEMLFGTDIAIWIKMLVAIAVGGFIIALASAIIGRWRESRTEGLGDTRL